MTLSGFVGEPTPAGAIDARSNFLRPAMLNQGAWPKGAGDLISTTADMARWKYCADVRPRHRRALA